jgi:Na+/pantothenate symporter
MSLTDWIVLACTLLAIVAYGVFKSGSTKNIDQYLGSRSLPWYHVGLSVMATQASAITFLSAPWPGLQRWDALCAVLLWAAAGHDRIVCNLCTHLPQA